jgi:hypothetical protein
LRQSADDHDPATTTHQEVSFPLDDDELLDWHGMQLTAKKHCSNSTLQLLAIIIMISLLVSLAVALLLVWQTNKASGGASGNNDQHSFATTTAVRLQGDHYLGDNFGYHMALSMSSKQHGRGGCDQSVLK